MKKTFQKTWAAALVGVLVPEQSPSAEPAPPLVVTTIDSGATSRLA